MSERRSANTLDYITAIATGIIALDDSTSTPQAQTGSGTPAQTLAPEAVAPNDNPQAGALSFRGVDPLVLGGVALAALGVGYLLFR